jgi:superfamily II DNA or RNA helicase
MSDIAAGEIVVARDEEWLVRSVRTTGQNETKLEVTGVSELVRDQNAVFYDTLDRIERVDPRTAEPVFDETPGFRQSRLWLESILRRSPVPVSDTRIAVGHRALLDRMDFQLRPAEQALRSLRPRILIGDAVGLGKTLEIGILLAELIRRGRGERILVVTPRAVLEQFQQELWTRFTIPLIRLDSAGIQKVRRTLPASRNPFSYYKRVIVSVDTLKNPYNYRHHLRHHRWDVVVIDECHNLINRGTQNNALARLLAEQTDALILASATPHNGRPESFAELVGLLDPTAIADPKDYTAKDIAHLYVRRHRNSPDVGAEVAHHWKQRAEPHIQPVVPTAAERAVLQELNDTWLHPRTGHSVVEKGHQLFPWTLFKAILSSPQALRASIGRRLKAETLRSDAEREALLRLDGLAEAAQAAPAKLAALRDHLDQIGIGSDSDTRVVIFSERIDTLTWLHGELLRTLRLPAAAVAVLHASLPDETVQSVVEGFGQGSSPIRVLLASDMASEGINLHQACHQLVHFDLPWSFIRIQQRNGRIDRYGQMVTPQITALALTSDDPQIASDLRVVTKLLQKDADYPDRSNRLVRVRALPSKNQSAWALVFSELDAPGFLVCDGATAIANAASEVWGASTVIVPCYYHARVKIRENILPKGMTMPQKVSDYLYTLTGALMAAEGPACIGPWFDGLEQVMSGAGLPLDGLWNVRDFYKPVLRQTAAVAQKYRHPMVPISNAGAEALIADWVEKMTSRRGAMFTNLPRTNLLGDLIVAGSNGYLDNQHAITQALRAYTREGDGWTPPPRAMNEPVGAMGLRDPRVVEHLRKVAQP